MKNALAANAPAPVKKSVLAKVPLAYTQPRKLNVKSELAEDLQRTWEANPVLESLLARLSEPDIRSAQADASIDAKIGTILAGRPDDLWVAHRIRKGRLGTSAKSRPVEAMFFRGETDRRALVIAGVHGSELQGIEVAQILRNALPASPSQFSVILVPALFPDNAAVGLRERPGTQTNRNFPRGHEDLATATRVGRGRPVDARTRRSGVRSNPILPENVMLIQLIERYKPERIISIHGTRHAGAAGVFIDPITPTAAQLARIRSDARLAAFLDTPAEFLEKGPGTEQLRFAEEAGYRYGVATLKARDRKLALEAAAVIGEETRNIGGREERLMIREGEGRPSGPKLAGRLAYPSTPGNVGATGLLDLALWSGSTPGGVSLGGYAASRGIGIFTIEPPLNIMSDRYPTSADPGLEAHERRRELEAYAYAIRRVLLGS